MAIKVLENGKWINVFGSAISTSNPQAVLNLDTTLTKTGYAAEARTVGNRIGDLTNLATSDKTSLVAALNEIALDAGNADKILIITCDMINKTANYSKTDIASAMVKGKLILGVTSDGLVLTFSSIGTYNTEKDVAIFNYTEVDRFGTVITKNILINDEKNVIIQNYQHVNPIDNINASIGQIAKVKEVNANGNPIAWEASDLADAENGILTVFIENSMANYSSTEIKTAINSGKYAVALMDNTYYPLTEFTEENNAKFAITQIDTKEQLILYSLEVASSKAVSITEIPIKDNLTILNSAKVGQTIVIKSVDENGEPIAWEAIDFPNSVDFPTFDLSLMGMGAVPDNGSTISLSANFNDLIKAFNAGPVFLKFKYFQGQTALTATSLVNPIGINNNYQIYILVNKTVQSIFCFTINSSRLSVFCKKLDASFFDAIKNPEVGEIGQVLVVKNIDDKGKPIEWEVKNISSGSNITTDTTLTISGAAADAEVVGDKLGSLSQLTTDSTHNLVAAINEVNDKATTVVEQVDALRVENQNINNKVTELNQTVNSFSSSIEDLQNKDIEIQESINEFNENISNLQEEDVNIRFEIDELSGKIAFLSDSNENIEIEIEGESGGSGGTVSLTIDSALSTTSTNPVQNKVITNKINELENLIGNGTLGGGGNGTSLNIDTTLTVSGAAADAKTVGDKIGNLSDLKASDKSNLVNAINELTALGSPIRVQPNLIVEFNGLLENLNTNETNPSTEYFGSTFTNINIDYNKYYLVEYNGEKYQTKGGLCTTFGLSDPTSMRVIGNPSLFMEWVLRQSQDDPDSSDLSSILLLLLALLSILKGKQVKEDEANNYPFAFIKISEDEETGEPLNIFIVNNGNQECNLRITEYDISIEESLSDYIQSDNLQFNKQHPGYIKNKLLGIEPTGKLFYNDIIKNLNATPILDDEGNTDGYIAELNHFPCGLDIFAMQMNSEENSSLESSFSIFTKKCIIINFNDVEEVIYPMNSNIFKGINMDEMTDEEMAEFKQIFTDPDNGVLLRYPFGNLSLYDSSLENSGEPYLVILSIIQNPNLDTEEDSDIATLLSNMYLIKATIYTDLTDLKETDILKVEQADLVIVNKRFLPSILEEDLPVEALTYTRGSTNLMITDSNNGFNYLVITKDGKLETICQCSSIAITQNPNKMSYIVDETFDPTGMIVTATRQDGTTEDVSDKCKYENTSFSSAGEEEVIINFKEAGHIYSATITVTVTE